MTIDEEGLVESEAVREADTYAGKVIELSGIKPSPEKILQANKK